MAITMISGTPCIKKRAPCVPKTPHRSAGARRDEQEGIGFQFARWRDRVIEAMERSKVRSVGKTRSDLDLDGTPAGDCANSTAQNQRRHEQGRRYPCLREQNRQVASN